MDSTKDNTRMDIWLNELNELLKNHNFIITEKTYTYCYDNGYTPEETIAYHIKLQGEN